MPKTDDQRAADAAFESAIVQAAQAYDLIDTATMVDFVAVVEGVKFDEDGELASEYYGLVFRNGAARTTVALGLLEKGRSLLLEGERVDPDDLS